MRNIIFSAFIILICSAAFAQYQTSSESMMMEPSNRSVFSKNKKYDGEGIELYQSNLDLKAHKRLGIGASLGGSNGLVSLFGEINVEPKDAAYAGLGFGPSYNSFSLGWKHNFEGFYLNHYTKVGYSKWFNSASGAGNAGNSDVLKNILSDQEIHENKFSKDFLVGSVGIEYNQLEGELSGVNLMGEVNLMAELSDFKIIPTGSIGIIYYY